MQSILLAIGMGLILGGVSALLAKPLLSNTRVIVSVLQGAGDTKFQIYSMLVGILGVRVVLAFSLQLFSN